MRECPLCFSSEVKSVFEPLKALECRACGFVYRDAVVPAAVYENAPAYASAAADASLLAARRREARKRAVIVAGHAGPAARVLEIGSNEGALLEELRALGLRATGIEPDPAMVEFSRKKGLEVLPGTLENNLAALEGKFDAVVMFHVLEHINRPVEALDLIHRALRPGGKLIVEVPGFDSPMFAARRWRASWAIEEHVSYFTAGTIKAILARTGFEPLLLTRRNWDAERETLRNNFLRLPGVSLLYWLYRRLKEDFEPFHARIFVRSERIIEKREPAAGAGALAVKLVGVLERGDAILAVARKLDGLPPVRHVRLRDALEVLQAAFLFFAALLYSPLYLFGKSGNKNILVVPTSKLGDLTAQIPFFKALRARFPDHKITALMFNHELSWLLNGLADEVVLSKGMSIPELFGLAARFARTGFFRAYLLPWAGRLDFLAYFSLIPERLAVSSQDIPFPSRLPREVLSTKKTRFARGESSTGVYLRLLDAKAGDFSRGVAAGKEAAAAMLRKFTPIRPAGGRLAGVVVGCANKNKLWAPAKWAQVCDGLAERGFGVVLIGSGADKGYAAEILTLAKSKPADSTGLFTLEELAAFFGELKLVVGVDTGPLYLANAVGTPVADISGPCDPGEQLPAGRSIAIRPSCGCAPCSYVIATERACRFGTRRCLSALEAAEVLKALDGFLGKI